MWNPVGFKGPTMKFLKQPKTYFKPGVQRRVSLLSLLVLAVLGISSSAVGETKLLEACPGLDFGVLGFAVLADLPKGMVLRSDDLVIDESPLLRAVEEESPEFREERKNNLIYVLEEELKKQLLLAEAYRGGYPREKPEEQAIAFLRSSKIPALSVSEEEIKAFYKENRTILGNLPLEQVAEGLREALLDQKREAADNAYLLELAGSRRIQIKESWVKENCALARNNPVDQARGSGKPTLVEFGATGCEGCDRMQPILADLEKKFSGKLNVIFIHVHHSPILSLRYGVHLIPVQAFFDKTGKEIFRHMGFFPQNEIEKKLAEMGVH